MKRKSISLSYRSSPLSSRCSLGRRFEKRVLNAAGKRILRERYVYVGYNCVQILNGDNGNVVEKEFVWDPTEPVSMRTLAWSFAKHGLNLFYAHDGNKNVSDVFFLAVQNGVAAHYEYAPFGAITRTAKNTPYTIDLIAANPFRFSAEFYDPELDLVYYNYRHYSPALGRFLSRDPVEEQGGANLYRFVGNNGITLVDINGLDEDENWLSCTTGYVWDGISCVAESAWNGIKYGAQRTVDGAKYVWDGAQWLVKKKILGVCGSSTITLLVVPDRPFFLADVSECCRNHDDCYDTLCASKKKIVMTH